MSWIKQTGEELVEEEKESTRLLKKKSSKKDSCIKQDSCARGFHPFITAFYKHSEAFVEYDFFSSFFKCA